MRFSFTVLGDEFWVLSTKSVISNLSFVVREKQWVIGNRKSPIATHQSLSTNH